jgi:mono/diheme cytochrome c family protein
MKPDDGSDDPRREVEELHRSVQREPPDPEEGRERGPVWLWIVVVLTLFGGGFYLGRFGGVFFANEVHVGFSGRSTRGASGDEADGAAKQAKAGPSGGTVYMANCSVCHQANGQGQPGSFPPLANSPWVAGDPELLVRIVLHGLSGPLEIAGQKFDGAMPTWQAALSDAQVAAVISYIRSNWGNQAEPVPSDLVAKIREAEKQRAQPWTVAELEQLKGKK